jgi:uncharacterized integral membrane protein (TIGR00697 family)
MNEFLFFTHIFVLLFFLLLSVRLGKNAILVFIVMQAFFANLFVTKQIEIFNLTATSSDVYVVSLILALNLLQEYFGKKEAKRAVNLSFLALVVFAISSKIHLLYEPSIFDKANNSFKVIFSNTPRIVVASFLVFFVVAKFDVWAYGFFRRFLFKNSLILSVLFTTTISNLLDTALFSYLGLYKVLENLFEVALISFLIKTVTVFCSIMFIYYSKKVLKKPELEKL